MVLKMKVENWQWVSGLGGLRGCGGCLVLFGIVRVVSSSVPCRFPNPYHIVACFLHDPGSLSGSGTAPAVPAGEPSGVKFAGRSVVAAVRRANWPRVFRDCGCVLQGL